MNRQQALELAHSKATSYLKRDNSGKGWVCPICGSGTGKNGTGLTTKDEVHYTCWAGCFTNADIIDIIGLQGGYSLTDNSGDKMLYAYRQLGINIDEISENKNDGSATRDIENATAADVAPAETADYRAFLAELQSQNHPELDKYLIERGVDPETAKSLGICYYSKIDNKLPWNALIIPTGLYGENFIGRNIDPNAEHNRRYYKSPNGRLHLFNLSAILYARREKKPVFIVEGVFDALPIVERGGYAVAMLGVTGNQDFIKLLKSQRELPPFIVAMDNDEAGQKNNSKIIDELRAINLIAIDGQELNGDYKDIGERAKAAAGDPEIDRKLREDISYLIGKADEAKQEEVERYINENSIAAQADHFLREIARRRAEPPIPTGFSQLDYVLNGGLTDSLYIIGAISSLGKTTFALQIADNVAAQGHDVLIFSLEMGQHELLAKSISRETAARTLSLATDPNEGDTLAAAGAMTANAIRYGRFDDQTGARVAFFKDAYYKYMNGAARHLYVTAALGNITTNDIKKRVQQHITATGKAPVVIVDYLQILEPNESEQRLTDKQIVDKAVTQLKLLSQNYKIPVIAVSSFNRANYETTVNMSAFKESGAIEYSADVLLGLQLAGAGSKNFDVDKEKGREKRNIELKVLKNRNGQTGKSIHYSYYAKFNLFQESSGSLEWDSVIN